jgi:hypothetical protein
MNDRESCTVVPGISVRHKYSIKGVENIQWCEIGQSLYVMISLLRNNYGVFIIPAVNNSMTDVTNLLLVDPFTLVQLGEESRECRGMIGHVVHILLLDRCVGFFLFNETEREFGRRRR